LWLLEDKDINATLHDGTTIPPQAYGDDITLLTDTPEQAQKGIDIIASYCDRYNVEIGIKAKSKTAWATTSENTNIDLSITDRNGTRQRVIPKLDKGEAYRYLGIPLDIQGSTLPIENDILRTVNYFALNLRWNYMTVKMKLDIVEKVLFPAIFYRAGVAPLSKQAINTITQKINYILYSTMNIDSSRNSIKHLQAPPEYGGFGLANFVNHYNKEMIATWIEAGLNRRDPTTKSLCAQAIAANTRLAQLVKLAATHLDTRIIRTPLGEEAPHLLHNALTESTTQALGKIWHNSHETYL
jgi:hypothetical protein